MTKVRLSEIVAPSFYELHNKIKNSEYTHFWLKGGRGSTKSSFISLEIIRGIMSDKNANGVILRKVSFYLKDSVYEQLLWAIQTLGVEQYWRNKLSPLELIYLPTGQRIVFRGADNPKKIKSTKFKTGYCKYIWYEEVDEFIGMDEIRIINQSLMRGGDKFSVFYSYNPPQSQRNWVNTEVLIPNKYKFVHHSTYLSVSKTWLGEQFFLEAEQLKETRSKIYNHEYMGEVIGTGGAVFENVIISNISDAEIAEFDSLYCGLDFGWCPDPNHFVVCYYVASKKKLYIFDEIRCNKTSNEKMSKLLEPWRKEFIIADNSEQKSISDFRTWGFNMRPTEKAPGSVDYSIKWLQSLNEIVIDNVRCPYTSKEFLEYEYERDKNGEVMPRFPDKNNHAIDAVRYAMTFVWRRRGE